MADPITAASPSPATTSRNDIQTIHELLSDEGFAGLDRNDHLHKIAELLKGESPDHLNQVLDGLSQDDLKRLGGELDHGGIAGIQGLDEGERKDLFNALAQHAGGSELSRVSNALGSRGEVEALGQSVANNATPASKADYVKALAPRTTDNNPDQQSGFGSASSTTGSPEARAAGSVLASLKGSAFDDAARNLSAPQLNAVMKAAETETVTTTTDPLGGAVSSSHDTRPLAAIINAAATGSDQGVKARVFEAGAAALTHIDAANTPLSPDATADEEKRRVSDALTGLIRSDTTGVIDRLNTEDSTGHAVTAYAKAMVQQGRSADLGGVIARLRQGNDLSHDPAQYLDATAKDAAGQNYYPHAEDLGYFVGSVQAAVNKVNSDAKSQGDALTTIFNTVASAGTAWNKNPAIKAGVAVFNGLTRQVVTSEVGQFQSGNKSLADTMIQLSIPHDRSTGEPVRLAALTPYKAEVGYVAATNP